MAGLEVVVMVVDARPELHFLQLDHVLLLARGAGGLGLLELVLPVVHDLDHGRPRHRRHLDQVETCCFRRRQRLFHRKDAHLAPIGPDHADRGDADLAVDTGTPLTLEGVQSRYSR